MSKIFCIVGKSCSGKDTLYNKIIEANIPNLIPIIPYSTRPMRSGEINGLTCNFVSMDQMKKYENEGKIVEKREYNTTHGLWCYFTLVFDVEEDKNYIIVTTLVGALGISKYYGDMVNLIYLDIDDKDRLLRYINRESLQKDPDYCEVCRRFIADQKDFTEENLNKFRNIHTIDTTRSIDECFDKWLSIYNILNSKEGE